MVREREDRNRKEKNENGENLVRRKGRKIIRSIRRRGVKKGDEKGRRESRRIE